MIHPRIVADVSVCRHVWQAVLAQAIRDIFTVTDNYKTVSKNEARTARAWIGTKDFHMVCALAGVDGPRCATAIQKRIKQAAEGEFDPKSLPFLAGTGRYQVDRLPARKVAA